MMLYVRYSQKLSPEMSLFVQLVASNPGFPSSFSSTSCNRKKLAGKTGKEAYLEFPHTSMATVTIPSIPQVFKKLGDGGFLCPTRQPEYGGLGLDYSYSIAIAEELGNIRCGGVPMGIGVHSGRLPSP